MRFGFKVNEKDGVTFLSVPSFDETGLCKTLFSTRLGGVSKPPLDSMNLGFGRGDEEENVLSNYRLLGNAGGFDGMKTVAFSQVHGKDVCIATEKDAGEAFLPKKREFDAIITNTPNLPIATYHADCTPVFLLDTKKHVVGVSHAGWRGTAAKTPKAAIDAMIRHFSSDPGDILAGIGPAIGKCCFETHGDVPDAILESFGDRALEHISNLPNGKFKVSLPHLNLLTLLDSGIPEENITLSEECTCCKSNLYWSHRKTGGVRGTMAAVIVLNERSNI